MVLQDISCNCSCDEKKSVGSYGARQNKSQSLCSLVAVRSEMSESSKCFWKNQRTSNPHMLLAERSPHLQKNPLSTGPTPTSRHPPTLPMIWCTWMSSCKVTEDAQAAAFRDPSQQKRTMDMQHPPCMFAQYPPFPAVITHPHMLTHVDLT